MTKIKRNASKAAIVEAKRAAPMVRAMLVERFPACFAGKGAPKPPLAIGMFDAILEALPEIGAFRLRVALVDYTSGPTYLRGLVEGAHRFALNGDVAGVVTASEAKHAAERMAGIEHFRGADKKAKAEAA